MQQTELLCLPWLSGEVILFIGDDIVEEEDDDDEDGEDGQGQQKGDVTFAPAEWGFPLRRFE